MTRIGSTILVLIGLAGSAVAQTATTPGAGSGATGATPPAAAPPPADRNAPANPALREQSGNTSDLPAPGANSFTEAQVRSRLEARGFSAIEALAKDADGVWRGRATRDGKTMSVAVDYQGNVIAQ